MASPGLDNLHIIEAGPIPANPSELLSTAAMRDFIQAVSAEYDIVLIDTPPILPVTDSAIVAGQVDGVLLVYQAGKVGRLVLKRAKAHLESARAKVWGIVLNDLQTEISGYTYTHYYTHYYGEEARDDAPKRSMHRVLGYVRDKLRIVTGGNGGSSAASAVSAPAVQVTPAADATADIDAGHVGGAPHLNGTRRITKRVIAVGVAVTVGLGAAFVAWRIGVPGVSGPRATLKPRLDAPPTRPAQSPVGARPTTAKPASPTEPPAMPAAPVFAPPMPPTVRPFIDPLPAPAAPTSPLESAVEPPARSAAPSAPAATVAPAIAAPGLVAPPPAPPAASTPAPPMIASVPKTVREPVRFALVLGPFVSAAEADRIEQMLIASGHDTARAAQPGAPDVYAVLIERVASAQDARTIIATLREQAISDASIVSTDPVVVRVGDARPLRGAVALAERVRKAGYRVRVAVQRGERAAYVIRHGRFATRDDAEARIRELARLGVPSAQVVQVQ
jgi:hypothetical protein